jgi:hypothetical protein
MKVTMVIPSYWRRKKTEKRKETDSVYDHPTPLDGKDTLSRALESVSILKNKDFNLVILGVSTAQEIQEKVESRLSSIVKNSAPGVEVLFFSYSHLKQIHENLTQNKKEEFIPLLQLDGYSNIRNLCLFSAHLLGSETAVLIDDDEIFEDPLFMEKALEYIGKKQTPFWMTHWNKIDCMNRAFKEVIEKEPRLKETPFVFGGNAVIHRDLFMQVPFDPGITRGEDIDFLINARMFGFKFFLDNQLSIKHDAPPKTHPEWLKVREDIYRFMFEKKKLETQESIPRMVHVSAEDLGIYPGEFLKDDLEERIFRSNIMLAMDYLSKGDKKGVEECMKNISLAQSVPSSGISPFQNLIQLQKDWTNLMDYFSSKTMRQEACRQICFPAE